jgi:hypothetical protein
MKMQTNNKGEKTNKYRKECKKIIKSLPNKNNFQIINKEIMSLGNNSK